MKIEDWIENARLRLGKEYPDVLIYIGRSFVNPKELIIGGVVNDNDEQKLFENYFNNQNPPVPIHFKIIIQNWNTRMIVCKFICYNSVQQS